MQRIVIDTNVLVSALISKSYPAFIADMFFKDVPILWCISEAVFQEYEDVLRRDRFAKYPGFTANAESLLDDIDIMLKSSTPLLISTLSAMTTTINFLNWRWHAMPTSSSLGIQTILQ